MSSRRDFFRQGFALGLGTLLLPPKLILPKEASKDILITPDKVRALRLPGKSTIQIERHAHNYWGDYSGSWMSIDQNTHSVKVRHVEAVPKGRDSAFNYFGSFSGMEALRVAFKANTDDKNFYLAIGDFIMTSLECSAPNLGPKILITTEWQSVGLVDLCNGVDNRKIEL